MLSKREALLLLLVPLILFISGCVIDFDKDGYLSNIDCDDRNPDVNPGATEVCNGIDDNCDGRVDEGCEVCSCPEIYMPVCGSDGVTYPNQCEADCKNVEVLHSGGCACGDGYVTSPEQCDPTAPAPPFYCGDEEMCTKECRCESVSFCGDGICDPSEVETCPLDCQECVSYTFEKPGNRLQISEETDTGIKKETLGDVKPNVLKKDFPILAGGVFLDRFGAVEYNETLQFLPSGYVIYTENDNDVASDFLYFRSGSSVAKYNIVFVDTIQSNVVDGRLVDFEGKPIRLFGREYSIVKAGRTTATSEDSVEIYLMGGKLKVTQEEGSTTTYSVNGKDYEVTVTAITDAAPLVVKFLVNGVSTPSFPVGAIYTLPDGVVIGVSNIIPNEAGDVTQDLVEFYIGAQRIFLKDTEIEDDGVSSNVLEVGSERIDDAFVFMRGTADSSTTKVKRIVINVTAGDDFYVPAGGKLSSQMDEPDALLGSWDIKYSGLNNVGSEKINIGPSAELNAYKLSFNDGDGYLVGIPIAFASGNDVRTGDNDDDFIFKEGTSITKNDYFIVSDYSMPLGKRKTYALRYRGADMSTASNPKIKFDNLAGERIGVPHSNGEATLVLGGRNYKIIGASSTTQSDFDIKVDLNGDGSIGTDSIKLTTLSGMEIEFIANLPISLEVVMAAYTDEAFKPSELRWKITSSNGVIRMEEVGPINLRNPESDNVNFYGYLSNGAYVNFRKTSPEDLAVYNPFGPKNPKVSLVSPSCP
ncbi:MAG TPA: MopE-related protein [Candidatus Nanoarchaeia archaeon]|nr:MopE-related protein [Candidatus Nanoarchaeia archaeon]